MTTTRSDAPNATAAPAAAAPRNPTTYSTPSDRELVITRTFDAPRSIVWAMFTDPQHLPNWHTGPDGFTMPVCEIDLRPGGAWNFVWRNARGAEFGASGTYREVEPPKRIVQLMTSRDGDEQTSTTTFTEENGRTTVTVSQLHASKTSRDQALPYAKMGTDSSYVRLDAYLASRS
jgi:uncharacterized protein YndB with AHSA1/START domain